MTSNLTGAARICGEQDCDERTSRPGHPLCHLHYLEFQNDEIDECPNCPGIYKPSEFPICRRCYSQRQQQPSSQGPRTGGRGQPQIGGRGWGESDAPKTRSTTPTAKAVELVRRNLSEHARECENNEKNTIQYLVRPMLLGLGWDVSNPEQVIEEYKPAGKQRYGQPIAVDIALIEKGVPKVFIEVKRLDRDYTLAYKDQLDKYASHLDRGIAILTNGKFWRFYSIANGKTGHLRTIEITAGNAEAVAIELHDAIGSPNTVEAVRTAASTHRPRPIPARPETIAENLRQYREREARRRRVPAYTIYKDETIDMIATYQPTDLRQLGNIRGVGPSTLEQHGSAIIAIIRGQSA